MALHISYFSWVRERMGVAEEIVDPPAEVATIGDLVAWLTTRDARGELAFAEPDRIRAAIGGARAGPETPLGAEVALFPPVTGG